jgi:hypothetical protein
MHRPIVPEKQISANKRAPAFQTLEGTFLGVLKDELAGSLVSTTMLTPAESSIAELAFILLL